MTDFLTPALSYLEANQDRILGELIEFAAIPSVSTDPAHAADMTAAREWVATALTGAGPLDVKTITTTGNSLVYGDC